MKRLHFLLSAALLTLSGCSLAGDPISTPIPADVFPTAIYQTAIALNATASANAPTATPAATATFTPQPTDTPLPTITLTPTGIPPAPRARIYVAAPGPMSKIVSPLQVRMEVVAGENHLVDIGLYGEDGRLIARELQRAQSEPPTAAYITTEIRFHIRAVELGRLEIVTRDLSGRIESLSNTFLLLQPVGESLINPPPPPFERAVFFAPEAKAIISGGVLHIEGAFWPLNDSQPVLIDIQEEGGRVMLTKLLVLQGDTFVSFSVDIPYQVLKPTPVRITIHQNDARIDGVIYLFSQLLTLAP
ncbi:MAG: hypothetical protein HFACDABA_01241 [Anaerolineales bacterium]|nr:hypothetical protein [Anaerolineales bacterium]